MISVYILALKNASFASIDDARTVFTSVNEFLIQDGRKPPFEVQRRGQSGKYDDESNGQENESRHRHARTTIIRRHLFKGRIEDR